MTDLLECWEGKVAGLRETHGLDDNAARLKAGDIFPEIQGELLREGARRRLYPGRIEFVMGRLGCDRETARRIVEERIEAVDVRRLHPDDAAESDVIIPSRPGGQYCPRPLIPIAGGRDS